MPNEPGMLQVVLMGVITVFVVLVCIIFIIKLMSWIINSARRKEDSVPAQPAAVPAPAAAPAPAVSADNSQLVAGGSGAIAESMGTEGSDLRIHSIKRSWACGADGSVRRNRKNGVRLTVDYERYYDKEKG